MRELDVPTDPLQIYDAALSRGDTAAVTGLVAHMLASGSEPVSVLTDVVAAAQREVGKRWQRGEWSVAEEHAATAMAISATKVVAEHVRRLPVTRGIVIVACAEREWHALPAMIIDCALRARRLGHRAARRVDQPDASQSVSAGSGSRGRRGELLRARVAADLPPVHRGEHRLGSADPRRWSGVRPRRRARPRARRHGVGARRAGGDRRHDRPARRGGTRRAAARRIRPPSRPHSRRTTADWSRSCGRVGRSSRP